MPGDLLTLANVFENGVGHFWAIPGTRPYMRVHFGLVDAMLHHFGSAGGRVDVVQAALDHPSGYAPAVSLGQYGRPTWTSET